METYKGLVLVTALSIAGEELGSDHRKHDLYHVEQRSCEGPERPTRPVKVDSGSGNGITGSAAITLPRLRVLGLGTFTQRDPAF